MMCKWDDSTQSAAYGSQVVVKEALSVLMLCAPVFIFTSGSSALLERPRYGLSIWLSLLAKFNPLLWVYANIFHEKTDKTREYSAKSVIFVWYENGRWRLLGAQSINSERYFFDCYRHNETSQTKDIKLQCSLTMSRTALLYSDLLVGSFCWIDDSDWN